jgi:type IV pilus assembly protein PilE
MLSRRLSPAAGRPRGFSTIDLLIALAVIALLAGIAWPTYAEQQRRVFRGDAVTRLAQLQQWQERWRSQQPTYGTLEAIGLPEQTPGDRYRLQVRDVHARGYVATATATGAQAADTRCRVLQLTVLRGNTVRASGADGRVDNDAATNDRCWLQ